MKWAIVGPLTVSIACMLFVSGAASAAPEEGVGKHVVVTAVEVRFVDDAGRPAGKARGGTVLDVIRREGDRLFVGHGWVSQSEVVPLEEALEYYRREIERQPTAVLYASRARVWCFFGEFGKAIADGNEGVKLDPLCATAYDRRAQGLAGKGEFDKALADFEKAIRLTPEYASTYSQRARAYYEKGDYLKAVADCGEALRRDPNLYLAYYYRGLVWARQGDDERAEADFTAALKIDPHYVPALNARGNTCYRRQEFAQAIADYTEALRLVPEIDRMHVHYNRGNCWFRSRKFAEAAADYKAAVEADPKYLPAVQALAASLAEQGDYRSAVEWQERAVKLAEGEQKAKARSRLEAYQANLAATAAK